MPPPNLDDLMGLYARRGIDDWTNAPAVLRRRANVCLGSAIADTHPEAQISIQTPYGGDPVKEHKFIPMPNYRHEGIERCFFLPIREFVDGEMKTAFDLFLIIDELNCLAFRFEPPDAPGWSHDYGHVQLSRKLLRRTIEPKGIPPWLPDSYPAFPIPSFDPLKMFLSMATAVHGNFGGIQIILKDIFQEASRSREARVYVNVLREMLN